MAVWMVRAGAHGEQEAIALENGVAVIDWRDLPDLSGVKTREELAALCRKTYPDASDKQIANWVGKVWAFRDRIKKDDLVVLPLHTRAALAIGRATGSYQYRADLPEGARHTRPTKWLRTDIPRNALGQDLLYSLGALGTVCQIQRNNAEERVRAVLAGKPDPGKTIKPTPDEEDFDLEQYARDQIVAYIGHRFRGHDLARLVDALLQAQGYRTQASPPGADGGVDIIAGAGSMGFDAPRLCVQVKSSDAPVDVSVLRELQGVMKGFGAQQGLLVAWGGFKGSVTTEARRLYFEIRLWDSAELVNGLLNNYERLPAEVQAELPLQRLWAMVPQELVEV